MDKIILKFLKKENVSAIISKNCATYRELSCIEVRYTKDGKYYNARSYCTDTWLAASPSGPKWNEEGNIVMDTIEDIAEITEYNTAMELKKQRFVNNGDVERLYRILDGKALQVIKSIFCQLVDYIYTARFSFTPEPMIVATIVKDYQFKGAVSLNTKGEAKILSQTDNFIESVTKLTADGILHCDIKEISDGSYD